MKYKILKLPAVIEKTGCRKSTIYKKISEGEFPTPIKLGERSIGWVEADVDEWIESKSNSLGERSIGWVEAAVAEWIESKSNSLERSSETRHHAEKTLNEQKTQNHSMPESLSLRAYFMASIRPPFNMSDAWVDQLAGPLHKDELGICATIEERILQFANAEAEYRRIFADAMIKALTK